MKTKSVFFTIEVDDLEYVVMFKAHRALMDVEPGLVPWDVLVTSAAFIRSSEYPKGCEFYFACKYPSVGDARTFLRMSLPALTEKV